jgi:hypothetical protein
MKRYYFKNMKTLRFAACILIGLILPACKKTCENGYSLSYESNLGHHLPKSDASLCTSFSTLSWSLSKTDSIYAKDTTILPISLFLDDVQIGTIWSATSLPGSSCDPILPANEYIIYTLKDGDEHKWVAKTTKAAVIYNGIIRASGSNQCITIVF